MGQWYLYTFNRNGIPLRPQSVQGVFDVKANKIYTSTPGIPVPGVFVLCESSSAGRASDFQSDGHGFETRLSLQKVAKAKRSLTFTIEAKTNGCGVEQWSAREFHKLQAGGSNPSPATIKAGIVQLVERQNHNLYVGGSSPLSGTNKIGIGDWPYN